MNLQQLRYVCEVNQHKLSISEAAATLFTSQPAVSKQIRLLEKELGVDIFVRHGKRLTGITAPGEEILKIASRILREIDNLKKTGAEFCHSERGRLSIATTHTQARHVLPAIIQPFLQNYPEVKLEIHQGNPRQVEQMLLTGDADLALANESLTEQTELITLPCYHWNRCIIAAAGHPVLNEDPLTLEAIARYRLITYDDAVGGRSQVNKAFLGRGLKPNIILTALDSDVIKTYVHMNMGIGILNKISYDPIADRRLGMRDASHLFETSTAYLALRKNDWPRGYVYDFIKRLSPNLTRKVIEQALDEKKSVSNYSL